MSYQSTILADNPIRYYRLDETSGTVATDLGSQAQNGTLNGGITLSQPGLLTGDSDTCELFDGTSGYISLPTTSLPTGAASWSVEVWVMFASLPGAGNYPGIISWGTQVANEGVTLWYQGDQNQFSLGSDGGAIANFYMLGTVAAHTNYHVVGTYDGNTASFYINGVLQGAATGTLAITLTSAYIGQLLSGTGQFRGYIDEPAIYNYALSSRQVSAHYIAGTTLFSPLLPRYIPRSFGATVTPIIVTEPLPYIRRAFGSTIIYENRTFIPRSFGGVYIPDTVLWVPRAFGSTIPDTTQMSVTLAGVGTLAPALSANTALSTTLVGVGQLSGTLSANTALAVTLAGVGTMAGILSLATALTDTLSGVGTMSVSAWTLTTALTTTLAGVGTLAATLSATMTLTGATLAGVGSLTGTAQLATALSCTMPGTGTLAGTVALTTALSVTVVGVGTLAGTLAFSTALTSSLNGVGTMAGTLSLGTALSLIFMGIGTLAGTITIPVVPYLSATWVTRDLLATWKTRDEQAQWKTRQ